ncbi:MAG: DNA repair protein RadC [Oscillospiraceae bacterium]|nr:DNA repair protein RadC [Oscillospiraceae bacterium]
MGIHEGHRKRLKEEFLARPDSFPDHKALELLLFYANPRGDTNPTAHLLLDHFGSLAGVLDATPEELCKLSGIGEHAVVLLKTVKELSGRYLTNRSSVDNIVETTKDAFHILRPYFFGARNEIAVLLCLDGKHKLLGVRKVYEGNVNAVAITARKVAETALSLNASAVILAHNHVSGLALPSVEDRSTTTHLKHMLSQLTIALIDHLIFVDDDMVSLRDSGYYQP